jgi:hypothetical protein
MGTATDPRTGPRGASIRARRPARRAAIRPSAIPPDTTRHPGATCSTRRRPPGLRSPATSQAHPRATYLGHVPRPQRSGRSTPTLPPRATGNEPQPRPQTPTFSRATRDRPTARQTGSFRTSSDRWSVRRLAVASAGRSSSQQSPTLASRTGRGGLGGAVLTIQCAICTSHVGLRNASCSGHENPSGSFRPVVTVRSVDRDGGFRENAWWAGRFGRWAWSPGFVRCQARAGSNWSRGKARPVRG